MLKILVCLVALNAICVVKCLISEIDMPPYLKDCIKLKTSKQDPTMSPSEDVCNTCVTRYVWIKGPNLKKCGHQNDNTTIEQISQFFGKVMCDNYTNRKKRQGRSYMRKEIRMLSVPERRKLRAAWKRAYDDGYFGWLARFHNDQIRDSAHAGPAFPAYHRFFVLMLESLLKYYDPDVTLPYWDSTKEANMENIANSVLWTDEYLGEMNGVVNTGLCGGFKDLKGNPITRNGGNAGSLFTTNDIKYLFNLPDMERLTEPSPYVTLESCHDNVHNWIGGTMAPIELAPWDCIFWLHHCFVDYLWEAWRYTHNYDTRYPYKPDAAGHGANTAMKNMPFMNFLGRVPTNKDGYSSELARLATYQLSPTCSIHSTSCGSIDLQCKIGRFSSECIPVDVRFRRETNPYLQANRMGNVNFRVNRANRKKRHADPQGFFDDYEFTVPSDQVGNIHIPIEHEPCMGRPIQNNFIADCSSDPKQWVFLPVKVVHLRPREVFFKATNGQPSQYDMYDEHNYERLNSYVQPGNPAVYQDCLEDESGAFKVRLKSSGLSYFGSYTDYVFVDNRLPVSSHIGYIAVQKPTTGKPTDVLITASDACGRLCKPTCRKQVGNHVYYEPCQGTIRVTPDMPFMYGNDFGEAVLSIWEFNGKFTPTETEHNIYLEFYCDYSNKWIWDEYSESKQG